MRINFEIPESVLHQLLDPVALPEMVHLAYEIPTPPAIKDIPAAIHEQMVAADAASLIKPGQRIAVGVGSRGIGQLPQIVASLVAELKALGAEPFIIPTMGSHGGATADGQRMVLAHLGVTPDRVGAPIESSMETVEVGRAENGTPVRVDKLAMESDGIVFVGRVKPHTAFRGPHESGLAKMIAIGLGKQSGAAVCHARGFGHMARMVPMLAEIALAKAPIRFGLAVLENAYDRPYKVRVVPANRIMSDEPALLEKARRAMPRIPFDEIDVLVIDQIGKNFSGDGADPNITGRYPTPDASGGPKVTKMVMLDLHDASGGNANGVGLADFTTVRLARKMDFGRTYPNALTSTVATGVALPMVLPSDRLALAAAMLTSLAVDHTPRVVRIKNTLHLDELWASASLLDAIKGNPALRILSGPAPIAFDAEDNVTDLGGARHDEPLAIPAR